MADIFKSIQDTKNEFEKSFQTNEFYNRQTQDTDHLEMIMNHLPIKDSIKVLDLGTGTGYLSFNLARRFNNINITGLDIVEKALEDNRKRALEENIYNLSFVSYDGVNFPFEDGTFDLVVTRYALHHFPAINKTFEEISRVIKTDGCLFLSDPGPNENDVDGFVDAYMQMKKDGHIKFYSKAEWNEIASNVGMKCIDGFDTEIRFPKKKNTALEFDDIIKRFDRKIVDGYNIKITEDEIFITEKVNNLLFKKTNT